MNNRIKLLRDKLENLISVSEDLVDCEIVSLSQEFGQADFKLLFKLIININSWHYTL